MNQIGDKFYLPQTEEGEAQQKNPIPKTSNKAVTCKKKKMHTKYEIKNENGRNIEYLWIMTET